MGHFRTTYMAINDFEYKSHLMFHVFLVLFSLIIMDSLKHWLYIFFYTNQQLSTFMKNDFCEAKEPFPERKEKAAPQAGHSLSRKTLR